MAAAMIHGQGSRLPTFLDLASKVRNCIYLESCADDLVPMLDNRLPGIGEVKCRSHAEHDLRELKVASFVAPVLTIARFRKMRPAKPYLTFDHVPMRGQRVPSYSLLPLTHVSQHGREETSPLI